MIIRQTPDNIDKFIVVDNDVAKILQLHNFHPLYMDDQHIYFKKNRKILNFMKGGEMIGKN